MSTMARFDAAVRRLIAIPIALAACVGLVAATPPPPTPQVPSPGVNAKNFCGTDWKGVRPNGGIGYNIYNDDFGARTCLFNDGNAGFAISSSTVSGGWLAYPNISSGWEWGRAPLHGAHYPVRLKDDGHPVTSVNVRLISSGAWNAAYDMWFSTWPQTTGQDNAAEVMIWLNCRAVCIGQQSPLVKIEGVWFRQDSWVMDHGGTTWRYTAFVAVRHRTAFTRLWLNPFYQAAGVHPGWWLTAIDFGFELVDGGRGLAVPSYSLSGVQ